MDDVTCDVWGTWEELILGGAVLRHGTGDWDVISSELRIRTVCPAYFTPEACRARYVDLQQRFTGCKYWYDELRERRVAELKRAVEKSEESIGFLLSKLENLKVEKGNCDQISYNSSQTESPPLSSPKTQGVKITTTHNQGSKDENELSAGSFTHDLHTNPSLELSQNIELKLEIPEPSCLNNKGSTIKKRRGKRKRKDGSWYVKDGIVESENVVSSSGTHWNETSTSGCDNESCRGPQCGDLVGIFNSVTENPYALVFRSRLDSQKRARYRKTIRQHMDLDTIRSKIANNCIKSTQELFKDLLLLANNALVFYSKRTREYKSALTLRVIITKRYKQLCNASTSSNPLSSIPCFSSMSNPPVRPRSIRPRAPCKQPKLVVKFPNSSSMVGPRGYLKFSSNADCSTLIPKVEVSQKSNVDFFGGADPKTLKRGLGRQRRVVGGGRGGKKPSQPPRNQKKVFQK